MTDRSLALVTGASSGIGFELARQFADHGFDLIVAAEDAGIARGRASCATAAGVRRRSRRTWQPGRVERAVRGSATATGRPWTRPRSTPGVGIGGDFARDTDLDDELNVIDLNVTSTVHLAKRVLRDMVARGEGRVLFTSSIASTMPGTYQAVYNASKSFVQSFAEALRDELQGHRRHGHRADARPDRHELLRPRRDGRHPGRRRRARTTRRRSPSRASRR